MSRLILAAMVLAGSLWLSVGTVHAQDARPTELRRAERDHATLRVKLDTLNTEIATLKGGHRSVRDDYRLRDRQAEAEAMALQVTQVEAKIRALGGHVAGDKSVRTLVETPRATGEENRFELEAKADLLADQSVRLMQEADRLAKASAELRGRQAMRKQAGKWDRDPFTGMESSKRNLPISVSSSTSVSPPTRGTYASDSAGSGTKGTNSGPTLTAGGSPTTSTESAPKSTAPGAMPTTSTGTSTGVGIALTPPTVVAAESSASSGAKVSPTPLVSATSDRLEQRVFLDPATAAQLRLALGSDASLSDPEALARASEVLRARARVLTKEEKALRGRGQ